MSLDLKDIDLKLEKITKENIHQREVLDYFHSIDTSIKRIEEALENNYVVSFYLIRFNKEYISYFSFRNNDTNFIEILFHDFSKNMEIDSLLIIIKLLSKSKLNREDEILLQISSTSIFTDHLCIINKFKFRLSNQEKEFLKDGNTNSIRDKEKYIPFFRKI